MTHQPLSADPRFLLEWRPDTMDQTSLDTMVSQALAAPAPPPFPRTPWEQRMDQAIDQAIDTRNNHNSTVNFRQILGIISLVVLIAAFLTLIWAIASLIGLQLAASLETSLFSLP